MKFEFNPDGSLKLPQNMLKASQETENLLKNQRCILIKRDIVSESSPKKCVLHITLSDIIIDNRFVETIYTGFRSRSEVPSKIIKLNEKEFDVEIGTCFRRCSDCSSLIIHFRNFFDGRVIDKKGNCSYKESFE
jgi:hypothetical protein